MGSLKGLLREIQQILIEEREPPERLVLNPDSVRVFGKLVIIPPFGKLYVIGDIHGEQDSLREILNFVFEKFREERDYIVFLGDYADRGTEGLEVFEELFELKKRLRERLILLRGNHEDRGMNRFYGFLSELYWKLGPESSEVYAELEKIYDLLPICAYVPEKLIMVHGGATVPPITLEEIARGREELQLLWNDPLDEDYMPRGGGTRAFSEEELGWFLDSVRARVMIRGHQFLGAKGHKLFGDKLISLFSARYGHRGAKIALLEVDLEESFERASQIIKGLHLL